jgi:hypothetical protein
LRWEYLKLKCRNCGDVVDPRRVELGYDYCLKDECQRRCLKRVELASVGVNKAADYYTTAEEVLPPPSPRPPRSMEPEEVEAGECDQVLGDSKTARRPAPPNAKHSPTTLDRLRQKEAELDDALRRSYDGFQRGEMTAREMERECDALVEAFNAAVRSENIRYRSMLRTRPARPRG